MEKFLWTRVLYFLMIFPCIAPVYGICREKLDQPKLNFISHFSYITSFTQADLSFK